MKSTNSVKKEHKDDLAVQKYVLENLGHTIRMSYLMHLNGEYVRTAALDLKQLFVLEPMDEEIDDLVGEVPNYLKLIRSKLDESEEPESYIGSVCKNPYPCEFKTHCWKNVSDGSIHNLVRISDKKRIDLADAGVELLKDIPDSFELTEAQLVQVMVAKADKAHVEADKINEQLRTLRWPLHFLDYETISYAIPKYLLTSPYQQLPFQYSLHIQKAPGGEVEHFEFLHRENSDPRKPFVESLLSNIDGESGSIVVYHAGFERNITDSMKQIAPELSGAFDEINARMWDLETSFAKRWYCHPAFKGSSSIKYVLPALVPTLTYKSLEIQKGDIAQKRYGEMILLGNKSEVEKTARDLLAYCKLDTLAMVEILKKLLELRGQ